jgi:hypothetical protein
VQVEVTDACDGAGGAACVGSCCFALLSVLCFFATGTSLLFVHRSVTRPGGGGGGGRAMRTRVSGSRAAMYIGASAHMAVQGAHAALHSTAA